jgi:neutral ceramidase
MPAMVGPRSAARLRPLLSLLLPVTLTLAACGDDTSVDADAGVDAGPDGVTTDHCTYRQVPATARNGGTVEAGALQAGAGEVILDVPVGTALGGYTARAGFLGDTATVDLREPDIAGGFYASIGVQAAPRAKAVALSAGGETVVLVRIDAIFVAESMVFDLEDRLGDDFAGKVLVAATHSHSAWAQFTNHSGLKVGAGELRDVVYQGFLDGMEAAAREALDGLRPARIGIHVDDDFDPTDEVTRDRRGDNDLLPGGDRKDTHLFVIRLDETDGDPIALIPIYGVHGTLLGEENSLASSDAVGGMEREVEERFDREVVVMHLQGAGGDVSPTGHGALDCTARPGDAEDPCFEWLRAEGHGRVAAPQILAAWEAAGEDMQDALALEMLTRSVELGPYAETFTIRDGALAYAPFDLLRDADGEIFDGDGALISPIDEYNAPVGAALCETETALFPIAVMPGVDGILPYGSCVRLDVAGPILGALIEYEPEATATRPLCQTTRTTISALRLGEFVLGTLPGEATVLINDRLRELSPLSADRTIVVGYAQGHVGYLLRPEDWLLGGYEPSVTFNGPLEGEYLVERVADLLPLALSATREDGAAGGVDRLEPPPIVDALPIDDPAPLAGTLPEPVPAEVWIRTGPAAAAQPAATIARVSGIATFVWIGDDPTVATPRVTLERETTPDTWVATVRASGRTLQDGELVLAYTPQPIRRVEDEPQTHYWSVEWQAVPWSGAEDGDGARIDALHQRAAVPLGRYRFHVVGDAFDLSSDPFTVTTTTLGLAASVDGTAVATPVRLSAPLGYRLLDMQLASNQPVPLRAGSFDVALLDADGVVQGSVGDVAIGGNGMLVIDVGAVPPGGSLRVTDAWGNVGVTALP